MKKTELQLQYEQETEKYFCPSCYVEYLKWLEKKYNTISKSLSCMLKYLKNGMNRV